MDPIFRARITGVADRPLDFGYQRQAFLNFCNSMPRSTAVAVVVKRYERIRSLPQNKYYWAVIVAMLAEHCGYDRQEMHESLKAQFLSFHDPDTGLLRIGSTTRLSTIKFIAYNERIKRWAAEFFGLYIPDPKRVFNWDDVEV